MGGGNAAIGEDDNTMKGLTLIDIALPSILRADVNVAVSSLEYIRQNIRSIDPSVPNCASIHLIAAQTSHNTEMIPSLAVNVPQPGDVEDWDSWATIECVQKWVDDNRELIVEGARTLTAPTWQMLKTSILYP